MASMSELPISSLTYARRGSRAGCGQPPRGQRSGRPFGQITTLKAGTTGSTSSHVAENLTCISSAGATAVRRGSVRELTGSPGDGKPSAPLPEVCVPANPGPTVPILGTIC